MNKSLCSTTSCLAVIDWQERLFPAMPEAHRDRALARASDLVWLARSLGMPVITSEQYPKGLGSTLERLGIDEAISKTTFSALKEPKFAACLTENARHQIILTGMEAHICVAQTACDLIGAGHEVWAVADAVLSRRTLDWSLGIERMRNAGAVIVTAEAAMFELLGQAGGPIFKELSRRIR